MASDLLLTGVPNTCPLNNLNHNEGEFFEISKFDQKFKVFANFV